MTKSTTNRISLNTEITCQHDASTGLHERTFSGGGVVTSTDVIDPEHWEEPDVWIRCRLVRRIDDHSVEIAVVSIDNFDEMDQQTYRLTNRLKVGVTTSDVDGTRHEPVPAAS